MSTPEIRDLGLADKNAGCSCCAPSGHAATTSAGTSADAAVVTDYLVEGMTCSHCVSSVTEEISSIPGVSGIDIDLKAGGVSRVRVSSEAPLDEAKVRDAVEEAGYALAPTS